MNLLDFDEDIILYHVVTKLDMQSVTNFSMISRKLQEIGSNRIFWLTVFEKLAFSYDIPNTIAEVIKEYRRIDESSFLAIKYYEKCSGYQGFDGRFKISGSKEDMIKLWELNLSKVGGLDVLEGIYY